MKKKPDPFEMVKIQRQELAYLRSKCKVADAAERAFFCARWPLGSSGLTPEAVKRFRDAVNGVKFMQKEGFFEQAQALARGYKNSDGNRN